MAQIKDLKRMCEFYSDCSNCELFAAYATCGVCFLPDNLDEIVDKWVKEHPAKTYAMDFFEKFPNAKIDEKLDVPHNIRACDVYGAKPEFNCNCDYDDRCYRCWNQEMKENA